MTTGRFFGLLLFAILMAAIGHGASYWYQYPFDPNAPAAESTMDLQPELQTNIEAQGRLQPASETIAVSALPGERIVELKVQVGQDVKAGDELAILASRRVREAEHQLAIAQEKKAVAQLESERALSVQRIKAAALAVEQAEAREKELPPAELERIMQDRRKLAFQQFQKLQQLRNNPATRDAITDAELEQQQLLIHQLDAEILQNKNKLEVARVSQQLAVRAAELDATIAQLSKEGVDQADPTEVLHLGVALAGMVYDETCVNAPCDGKILEIYARQGERVTNTPILLMGDLSQMICLAEVHEANLQKIDVEDKDGKLIPTKSYAVTIKNAALNNDLHGTVVEVGRFIGAPKLRDPNPLARGDLRTAQVKIQLDDDSSKAARRFVHLQVNVTIHLQPQNSPLTPSTP